MNNFTATITDLPPSANNLHTHFIRNNKIVRVKAKPYDSWRTAAIWELKSQVKGQLEGSYRLTIHAERNWKSKRARDIDNLIKPISDAIVKAGLVQDDSLAESVSAQWSDIVKGVLVTVTQWENSPVSRGV